MPDFATDVELREGDDDAESRLVDIRVDEVSIVDRAANKRKFLVVKRDDMDPTEIEVRTDDSGNLVTETDDAPPVVEPEVEKQGLTIPGPVKAKVLRMLTEVLERGMSLANRIKGAKETDEQTTKPLPAEVGREIKAIGDLLGGISERYPSTTAKADEPVEGDAALRAIEDVVEKAGRRMSSARLDRFRKAIDLLNELLSEVANAELALPPSKPEKRKPTRKAAEPEPPPEATVPLAKFEQSVDMVERLSKIVEDQQRQLDDRAAQVPASNATPVQKTATPSRPTSRVSWPRDMNRPITRDTVNKSKWIGSNEP